MSNVNILLCQNHQKRKAYRYCEECNEFICNACAFQEKHLSHLQKIKSFSDTLKFSFPQISSLNISSLSKYVELFHFIINYNSSFMPFDLNNIFNQINDKFDEYINKLIELKNKFKILISEKFEIIDSVFSQNEKKVLETQNKILSMINNQQSQYFEKMNICLDELCANKNEKNIMNFVNKYNELIKESFDDENDFKMKYNLYLAQKEVVKNNKLVKENILDKLVQPCFKEALKNIENVYNKINAQNNKDLDSLKKKFDYLIKNPNKFEIEDEEKDEKIEIKNQPKKIEENKQDNNSKPNPFKVELKKVIKEQPNKTIKEEPKQINKEEPKKVVKEEPKQINKEEPKKIVKEEPKKTEKEELKKVVKAEEKKVIKEEPKKEPQVQKIELLEIEFEPPDIESNHFTKKELEEMGNDIDDEYEEEFLKIEEDGDDGMLLAEIIDGNTSEEATVNLEEFFINNMDDKLDIQYYEGIKFEGEAGGEGLNDEAMVEAIDDDNKDEQIKEEPKEEVKKEEPKEEPKEELKEEPKEEPKKEIIKNEEVKKGVQPKVETKKEQPPKKMNAIEEMKMKMFANKQGFNPQQMLKPIPGSTPTTNPPPKKLPGKLNSDFMNRLQNKFGGNEAKVPQPQPPKKKEEPANNINQEDNNIGQFIEEKNEQTEEQQNNNENNNETPIEEDTTPIVTNPNEKDRLKILCSIIKKGGRNRLGFQTLFNELSWEERGKVEIMAINHKNNSVHIYNELSNKIEEVKVNTKFPLHLSYINLPPYLYISGGKVNGKDSTSLKRLQRVGQNEIKYDEIAQLNTGRSYHCTVYVQSINSLFFISGSRIKSCEKYSLTKEKMESFPGLKVPREKCCACLLNEKYLYVFFGFDRTRNKFETSVERIFINDAMSWETLKILGNENSLKKQNFSCIPHQKDGKKGVIIVGGINSLRNETKETIFIDIDANKSEIFNSLPINSTFTNSYFIHFDKYSCENEMINISNELNVIRFNLDNNSFIGP